MNYIGMDIHKQFTVAVVKDDKGNKLANEKFDNSKNNFENFLKDFIPEETKIVIESSSVWEYVYDILEEMRYEVKLANPFKTRAIAEARKKTDLTDAETLADLLRANLIVESYIPPKEIRKLRELTRERRVAVKQTTQIKNRIHAILTKRGIKIPYVTLCKRSLDFLLNKSEDETALKNYLNLLEKHKEELKLIDFEITEIASKNSQAQLLMTIPGISSIRAMHLVAEIGDINRFKNSEAFCSYSGLVPGIRQSGNTLKFGKLVKQANTIIKSTLIEASWNIVRTKELNQLQIVYKRLSKKKGKQKAICAVARKLAGVIHAMLRKNRTFMLL